MFNSTLRRLLTASTLCLAGLTAGAQFTGGDGSGTSVYALVPTTCSAITYPAIFGGGDEDGYSQSAIVQTSCSPVIMPSVFSGGSEDGYSYAGITQSSCVPISLPSIFSGGIEDGYAWTALTQSNCGTVVLPSIYSGGPSNTDPGFQLNAGCAPLAAFSANPTSLCAGDTVQFTDLSNGGPTTWLWTFPGGQPASSTLQNPLVVYDTPGIYDVSLTVTSVYGNNSITIINYIHTESPPLVSFPDLSPLCENDSPVNLNSGSPAGGIYSGPGVIGGTFDPALSGNGTHDLFYTYTDISGCSATDTALVNIHPTYEFITNANICNGNSYTWRGNTYAAAGTYYDALLSSGGCDSVYTLVLSLNPSFNFNQSHIMCSGDSYTWQGNTYTFPGNYSATYQTVNGCDSIYNLNLSLRPSYAYTQNQAVCQGESFFWQGNNYSTAGTYNITYSSVDGCDSSYTLNLSVYPVYSFNEQFSICQGDVYTWHGNTYNAAGSYTASYQTIHGCDSIYHLTLNVNPVYAFTDYAGICPGDQYNWQGSNYTLAGTYTADYLTSGGCDSTYTLILDYHPEYLIATYDTICDGDTYLWQGNIYTTGGTYPMVYSSVNGCDSTLVLHLFVQVVDVSLSVADPVITANATAEAYQWLDCDNSYAVISGETAQSYTAHSNGNFAVAVTQNGCTDTSACVQILTVGIEEADPATFSFYPNPNGGSFVLVLEEDAMVALYNNLGSLVWQQEKMAGSHEINLVLADGVYLIRVSDAGGDVTRRMIIKK
jgi:PKD repeat protein